ncbi:hypothetical protein [Phenylobacterium sp.]|jgi:hypothetical protein|uniref:hypothetical protein n=1 Tax=Phenylobacterium sp. TaxID=1871053 RepID=UPI0037CB544F
MAITRIIALFNLKPGVKMSDYEAWARAKDLPTVNGLPSIKSFQVFKTKEVMGGGKSPYKYIEIIDVRDMGQFGTDVSTPVMQAIASEFQGMADVQFLIMKKIGWKRKK